MWSMIVSLVQGIVTGVVGPVFTYLGKKQDVTLAGAQSAMTADQANFAIEVAAQERTNNWWGPHLLYMVAVGPAVLHVAMIFLDSSFRFGCGHYGCLSIPELPLSYRGFEHDLVYSLIIVGPTSALTQWLHRK